jgi:hypothetical protein
MMTTNKGYMAYAAIIIVLYVYAESTGWKLMDSVLAGTFRPVGRSTFHK